MDRSFALPIVPQGSEGDLECILFTLHTYKETFIREEMNYRFDIILYTHRIIQMFEFPTMDILASKNKTR